MVVLTGDATVKVNDTFTVSIIASDNINVKSLNINEQSILGLDSKVEVQNITTNGNNVTVTLMAKEMGSVHLSIAPEVAIDDAGNTSSRSNEIGIIIESNEIPEEILPEENDNETILPETEPELNPELDDNNNDDVIEAPETEWEDGDVEIIEPEDNNSDDDLGTNNDGNTDNNIEDDFEDNTDEDITDPVEPEGNGDVSDDEIEFFNLA